MKGAFMTVDSDVRVNSGYFAREALRRSILDGMGKLQGE
jgi:hypothetical protein